DNVRRWAAINRVAEQTPMLLPAGDEGERRARGLMLSIVDRKYQSEPPPERSDSPEPTKIAWEKWSELRDQIPSPSVYAPYRWQKYQSGVLRVEQLLRQGDFDGAQQMQVELDRIEKQLRQDAPLSAPSLKQAWAIAETDGLLALSEPIQQM